MVMGTGAMGLGIIQVLRKSPEFEIVAVSDIDPIALNKARSFISPKTVATKNSKEALKTHPDILIDSTNSILDSAIILQTALEEGINVILMNGEVDQVFGRLLLKTAERNHALITSDSGDQHGVLKRTIDDVRNMGFEIVMAGNNKGFLNRYANPDSIELEAAKRRLTRKQCSAYTDGTKLAIEMAIIANAENLGLLKEGMIGPKVDYVVDALSAFDFNRARDVGGVVDYVLNAKPGGSVFVVGYSSNPDDMFYMNYYKMGSGPYYIFVRPYHLCHFETPLTIKKIMLEDKPILVQKYYSLEVNSYAKTPLKANTKLDGIGGFHLYGLLGKPTGLPIGLSERAILVNKKEKDQSVDWSDVTFKEDDPILDLWKEQEKC